MGPFPVFVVFDFDRTLGQLFSDADASSAARRIVRELADPRLTLAEDPYATWAVVRSAIRTSSNPEERSSLTQLERSFRELLRREELLQMDRAILYPHTRRVVNDLFSAGITLAVVSNNDTEVVEGLLGRWSVQKYITTVVARSETTPVYDLKPSAIPLLSAIQTIQMDVADGLYVGDSIEDAICASAASIPFIAVTTGKASAGDFGAYRARAVINDLYGILALVEDRSGP
jgi:phosphoglycolate phosphatase